MAEGGYAIVEPPLPGATSPSRCTGAGASRPTPATPGCARVIAEPASPNRGAEAQGPNRPPAGTLCVDEPFARNSPSSTSSPALPWKASPGCSCCARASTARWARPAGAEEGGRDRHAPDQQLHGALPDRAAGAARRRLHGPELALRGQRHAAADGARDPGPGRGRAVPARAGLRQGGAGRQFGRRVAGGLLPGAGRAPHHRAHGRRRPGGPVAAGPAAGAGPGAVRRARGPLHPDAAAGSTRRCSTRTIRCRRTPTLDMYDPAQRTAVLAASSCARFRAAQQARLARIDRWVADRLALLRGAEGARQPARPGVRHPPHPRRPALPGPVAGSRTTAPWAACGGRAPRARGR